MNVSESPCVFSIYAVEELEEPNGGFKIGGRNISNLPFADNMTLVENQEDMEALMRKVKEQSEKMGLNMKKSKILTTGKTIYFTIHGEYVEKDNSFCLLGQIINNKGSSSQEI